MKLKLLLCFLIPFGLSSQNLDNKLNIKYESGIESLISKNEAILSLLSDKNDNLCRFSLVI